MLLAMSLTFAMQTATPALDTGAELYKQCKDYIALVDRAGRRTFNETLGAGRCLGYVQGLAIGAYAKPFMCNESATVETTIRVYIAYMDKNPKQRDEQEAIGVVHALSEAYPCSK